MLRSRDAALRSSWIRYSRRDAASSQHGHGFVRNSVERSFTLNEYRPVSKTMGWKTTDLHLCTRLEQKPQMFILLCLFYTSLGLPCADRLLYCPSVRLHAMKCLLKHSTGLKRMNEAHLHLPRQKRAVPAELSTGLTAVKDASLSFRVRVSLSFL